MLREPPLWLYSKGRLEEGLANLCWLRNLDPSDRYILEEVTLMEQRIDTLPKGFFDPIRTAMSDPKIQWRLFIGHMLFIFQNFGGINAIVSPQCFPIRHTRPVRLTNCLCAHRTIIRQRFSNPLVSLALTRAS